MSSTTNALRWMLWREFLDQRQNRMLWPVYFLMPLIGAALPALLAVASASMLAGKAPMDPQLQSMLGAVRMLAAANGTDLNLAAATMLLRVSAGYFLLMPLAIVSIAGAYAIVGEKQQRSLEPVLATPLSTTDFLIAKMVAVIAPAVLMSWIAALIGAIASVASFYLASGLLVWPDAFYWIAVLILAPEIGAMTALVCLRVSARMQDPQAANQVTALILVPALLIVFSVIGPALVMQMSVLLGACVVGLLLTGGLFVWVKRGFNREEILCRWR
jgi:ABC-2 type transport system permease protein